MKRAGPVLVGKVAVAGMVKVADPPVGAATTTVVPDIPEVMADAADWAAEYAPYRVVDTAETAANHVIFKQPGRAGMDILEVRDAVLPPLGTTTPPTTTPPTEEASEATEEATAPSVAVTDSTPFSISLATEDAPEATDEATAPRVAVTDSTPFSTSLATEEASAATVEVIEEPSSATITKMDDPPAATLEAADATAASTVEVIDATSDPAVDAAPAIPGDGETGIRIFRLGWGLPADASEMALDISAVAEASTEEMTG